MKAKLETNPQENRETKSTEKSGGGVGILKVVESGRNRWFQKISIPIPRAASRNSEGEGGYVDWNSEDMGGFIGLEFQRHGGIFRTVTSSLV